MTTTDIDVIQMPRPGTIISEDGTVLHYKTTGKGPGLILVHGVLSAAADYGRLAEFLGKNFTVYSIERRGRGLSGPQGNDYSLEKECEDIEALQAQTQASYLFGHSYGGLIALEAARNNLSFKKVAVYEPGVSIDGSIAMGWVPAYEKYLAQNKPLNALAAFSVATGPEKAQKMPFWLMKLMLPFVIKKEEREKMYSLLPSNLPEHIEVAKKNNTYKNYQEVSAKVLLMSGGKSDLKYVDKAIKTLTEVLPVSETKKFLKLDHFGPDKTGPGIVAEALKEYFLK